MKGRRSLALFALLLIVGLVLVNGTLRHLQNDPKAPVRPAGMELVSELTDAQKAMIASRQELAKWLIGLAYASLVGLLAALLKAPDERLQGPLPLAAAAALVVSLYSGYLMHQATAFVLREGPIQLLYARYYQFPVQAQLWFLLLGLTLLAWPLLGKGRGGAAAAAVVLALLLPAASQADEPPAEESPDAPEVSWSECVEDWSTSRGIPLDASTAKTAGTLAQGLAAKAEVTLEPADRCTFTSSLLDDLRFQIRNKNRHEAVAPKQVAELLSGLLQELKNPDFSPGEWLEGLLELSRIWRAPSGVLLIEADRGLTIHLDADIVGRTDWVRRLEPRRYRLRLSWAGRVLRDLSRKFELRDGDLLKIRIVGPVVEMTRNGEPESP